MEERKRLSKGLRRHIRQEKATIRRQFGNGPESQEKIRTLVALFRTVTVKEIPQAITVETPTPKKVTPKPKKKLAILK